MKLLRKNQGFTLIELLVVVSIIALLAVGAMPLYGKIMLDMKAKAAMKSAYQIHQALFAYAQTHDQAFPSKDTQGNQVESANDAYRQLFVGDLIDDEKLFFVKGSPWHGKKSSPDGNIGTRADEYKAALEGGENHWGYVRNLTTDRDDTTTPIVMDGGTDSGAGVWTDDPKAKGGFLKGRYAVVVRIGGNAQVLPLDASFHAMEKKNGESTDLFGTNFVKDSGDIINPLSGGE